MLARPSTPDEVDLGVQGSLGSRPLSSAPTLPCQAALRPGHGGPCLGGVA